MDHAPIHCIKMITISFTMHCTKDAEEVIDTPCERAFVEASSHVATMDTTAIDPSNRLHCDLWACSHSEHSDNDFISEWDIWISMRVFTRQTVFVKVAVAPC